MAVLFTGGCIATAVLIVFAYVRAVAECSRTRSMILSVLELDHANLRLSVWVADRRQRVETSSLRYASARSKNPTR
ncbi:hypothetical protein NK718_12765 [Alsobacter sp. SYSU M60028]|uniref:Secreted protein n=1 Tax=Alsobacter ponti TaxID=2962936 RepID=A0ABT1LD10_9HYPH|nr:hypothetical protein [Alsobacter ponti]MCP8939389.1 hypothetical protein [Alsobacter ponti]